MASVNAELVYHDGSEGITELLPDATIELITLLDDGTMELMEPPDDGAIELEAVSDVDELKGPEALLEGALEAELELVLTDTDGVGGGTMGIVKDSVEPIAVLLEMPRAAELETTGLDTDVGTSLALVTELANEAGAVTGTEADEVGGSVTGQTVVVTATTDVTIAVPFSGQLVTSEPHWKTVYTEVVKRVEVVQASMLTTLAPRRLSVKFCLHARDGLARHLGRQRRRLQIQYRRQGRQAEALSWRERTLEPKLTVVREVKECGGQGCNKQGAIADERV